MIIAGAGLIVLRGLLRGIDVYDAFLRGARRGMDAALSLLPSLCAMLLLLSVMNGSGLSAMLGAAARPLTELLHLPEAVSPMLLLRPLTGSGSIAAMEQIFRLCGPDSRAGQIASVLMGSSETIFYTMTVYLGAAGVKKLPWVLPVSLAAYLAGAAVCGAIL